VGLGADRSRAGGDQQMQGAVAQGAPTGGFRPGGEGTAVGERLVQALQLGSERMTDGGEQDIAGGMDRLRVRRRRHAQRQVAFVGRRQQQRLEGVFGGLVRKRPAHRGGVTLLARGIGRAGGPRQDQVGGQFLSRLPLVERIAVAREQQVSVLRRGLGLEHHRGGEAAQRRQHGLALDLLDAHLGFGPVQHDHRLLDRTLAGVELLGASLTVEQTQPQRDGPGRGRSLNALAQCQLERLG
jgi:hypothetical protein